MKTIALAAAALLATGCANTNTPVYDSRFGDAVRNARQAMLINPKPSTSPDAAMGIDGTAAALSAGRYHESFKSPPPPVNVINIGGSVSGRSGGQ